jgi:glycosyltransferase involved in cell wall biosynthesis
LSARPQFVRLASISRMVEEWFCPPSRSSNSSEGKRTMEGRRVLWILNHYAVTPDLPGGTRHFDLARELVRRGWEVTILASAFHHGLRRYVKLAPGERWRVEEVDGVRVVWIRTTAYQENDRRRILSMVDYMFRAWWIGRKLPKRVPAAGRPAVVLGSSVHLLAVVAAWRLARRYRAKFIMEVRDLWPQTLVDMGEMSDSGLVVGALRHLERFLYHKAELIITLPPRAHEYITARGIPKERIIWLPNGVDLSRTPPPTAMPSAGDHFTVLYAGSHGLANGLHILLEAAEILQRLGETAIRLVLAGDGPEKGRLIALRDLRKLTSVEFRDPVTKAELPRLLEQADVCVVDTDAFVPKYGTSPNKLPDYLASGRPVIILSDAPQEVVDWGAGTRVGALDSPGFAQEVLRLSRLSKEERAVMGAAARRLAEERYDIRQTAGRLEECLVRLTQGGTRAH